MQINKVNQVCKNVYEVSIFLFRKNWIAKTVKFLTSKTLTDFTEIYRQLSRYKQLGGWVPALTLGIPLRYNARELCYPLIPLYKKRTCIFLMSHALPWSSSQAQIIWTQDIFILTWAPLALYIKPWVLASPTRLKSEPWIANTCC